MTLVIKRIQNLPPHISYVSTLPDITQKNETRPWRAEAEAHWQLVPYSSGHRVENTVACICKGKETPTTSNAYCDVATQLALFRDTSDPAKPVLFRATATHTIEKIQRN